MHLAYRIQETRDEAPPAPAFFRVGAISAAASGVLALLGNMAHGPADVSAAGLHHLAGNGHFGIYRADHFLLALALIFAVCGYAAIADAIKGRGAHWGRFAMLLAQLGAAVIMVALGIDGFAMIGVARAWAHAAGSDQQMIFHVAQALWSAFVGIFALGVFVFFGCAPLVAGLGLRHEPHIARWLAPAAIAGGIVGLALGVVLAFVPITFGTYAMVFGTSSSLLAAWMTGAGLHIWRTAGS